MSTFKLEQQKIIKDALQTIEQYPDDVEAHKQAAISFLRLGSPSRSLSAVKVALVLQPGNLASLLLCGEAAEQQADFEEASKCYHAVYDEIKGRPADADTDDIDLSVAKTKVFRGLMSWARVLIRKNEFPQAYLVLLRCQLLHGYSSELANMIGNKGFNNLSSGNNYVFSNYRYRKNENGIWKQLDRI